MTPMQKARAQLLLKNPFFATLALTMPFRECKEVGTAATNSKEIIYNPEFIASLPTDVVTFVVAHEVMHVAFKHGLRMYARRADVWNIACDHAINLLLKESGFALWERCCANPQFTGMSAEQIYDELMQDAKSGGRVGDPESGLGGDLLPPDVGSVAEREQLDRDIQQKVAMAANAARMAGKLSAGLERFVNQVLNPQVPWQVLLRDYMTATAQDDESWVRRNRRFQHVVLPSRYSERMGEIVVIGDTSGSVSNEELAQVAAEVSSIADTVRPERIRLIWADTKVAGEQLFEVGEPIVIDPKGGGGTDMCVPLKHVEQFDPCVVVLCTDGGTPWPDAEPPFPLIVCCTTTLPVPIGQVVRMQP